MYDFFVVELQKAQNHLSLLRQEYVKLQNRFVELEQKYNLLLVESGGGDFEKDSFVARLLKVWLNYLTKNSIGKTEWCFS